MRNNPLIFLLLATAISACGKTEVQATLNVISDDCYQVTMLDTTVTVNTTAMVISASATNVKITTIGTTPEPCKPISSVDIRIFTDKNGDGEWTPPDEDGNGGDKSHDHTHVDWQAGSTTFTASGVSAGNVPLKDDLYWSADINFGDGTHFSREKSIP